MEFDIVLKEILFLIDQEPQMSDSKVPLLDPI